VLLLLSSRPPPPALLQHRCASSTSKSIEADAYSHRRQLGGRFVSEHEQYVRAGPAAAAAGAMVDSLGTPLLDVQHVVDYSNVMLMMCVLDTLAAAHALHHCPHTVF
jgi:hypothetical protein